MNRPGINMCFLILFNSVRCGIVHVPVSLQTVTPSTVSALRSSLSRKVDGRKNILLSLKDALEAPTPSDS